MSSELLGFTTELLKDSDALATAEEIAQQPALWRQLPELLRAGGVHDWLKPILAQPDLRIILTGAGTSAFAGEILAPALTRHTGHRVDAIATTDLVSNPGSQLAEDRPTLLVSFARSGDSPESAAATELADQCLTVCHHLILTCNPSGALARGHSESGRSSVLVMPAAANDTGFAMTSSFTCMTASALLALAPELLPDTGLEQLAGCAEQILLTGGRFAKRLTAQGFDRVVYLGSGPLKGLAQESALKMLELTAGRVATWHESPLGFRHGPKSVINERTLVLVYLSADPYTRRYDEDIVTELQALIGPDRVIAITGPVPGSSPGLLDDLDDAARAVALVVLAQIVALHHSLALGLTPDNPFPSGAVNRVVEGVTIHPHPTADNVS